MKVIYKMWLEQNGGRIFGEGPYRLLKGIERTGSLLGAANSMGLAYNKARRVITGCERRLGFPLTRRKAGGVSGGGSKLTPEAAELMKRHETLCAEIEDAIGSLYKKHFGQSAQVQFYAAISRKRGGKSTG